MSKIKLPKAKHNQLMRLQILLEKYKQTLARDLTKKEAIMINTILKKISSKERVILLDLPKSEFNILLRDITKEIDTTNNVIITNIKDEMEKVGEAIYRAEEKEVIGDKKQTKIDKIIKDIKQDIKTKKGSFDGKTVNDLLEDLTARNKALIINTVNSAYANGLSTDDIYNLLRGNKVLNYRDGALQKMSSQLGTIIRTVTQKVMSDTRINLYDDYGVEKYRIVATLDTRTSLICQEEDGKEYIVGRGPTPPFHPNCRTSIIAVISDDYLEGATRASKDGYVDADITYYEWLESQESDIIYEALGKSRGDIFIKGGQNRKLLLNNMTTVNNEIVTVKELKERLPKLFE